MCPFDMNTIKPHLKYKLKNMTSMVDSHNNRTLIQLTSDLHKMAVFTFPGSCHIESNRIKYSCVCLLKTVVYITYMTTGRALQHLCHVQTTSNFDLTEMAFGITLRKNVSWKYDK